MLLTNNHRHGAVLFVYNKLPAQTVAACSNYGSQTVPMCRRVGVDCSHIRRKQRSNFDIYTNHHWRDINSSRLVNGSIKEKIGQLKSSSPRQLQRNLCIIGATGGAGSRQKKRKGSREKVEAT